MEPTKPGFYRPYGDPAPNPYEQTVKTDDYGLPVIPPPPPEKKRKSKVFVIAIVTLVGVLLAGMIGILIYRVSTANPVKATPTVTSYTPPAMTTKPSAAQSTPTLSSMPTAANTSTTISNNDTCVLAIERTSTSIELIGNDAITACNQVSTGVVFSQMQTPTTPCASLQACTDTNPVDYVERMQYNLANEYQYNLYVEASGSHASPEICETTFNGLRFIVYDTLATSSATNACNYLMSG